MLPAPVRREIIAHVASTYRPNLLLCAGWSSDENADLDWIVNDQRIRQGITALIVEVQRDQLVQNPLAVRKGGQGHPYRVYLVGPRGRIEPIGYQVIVQGANWHEGGRVERFGCCCVKSTQRYSLSANSHEKSGKVGKSFFA